MTHNEHWSAADWNVEAEYLLQLGTVGRHARLSVVKSKPAVQTWQTSAWGCGVWQLGVLLDAVLGTHELLWRKKPLLQMVQVVVDAVVEKDTQFSMMVLDRHMFWFKYIPDWHELHIDTPEYVAQPKMMLSGNRKHAPLER